MKRNNVLFRVLWTVVIFVQAGFTLSSFGQTPSLINCQGRLFDGQYLLDGEVTMILRIYDQAEGGRLMYEDVNKVQVVDGIYSTFLGDNTTRGNLSEALSTGSAFLEVTAKDTTFMPREQLSSVPFAKVADGVRKAGVTADMIGPGSVNAAALAPGAVNTDHIADGAVTPPKLSEAYWSTSGNVSQGGKITFLGTLDGRPLDMRVGNKRAFRLEPAKTSPNVVGGHEVNRAGDGVNGATIGGGGSPGTPNKAAADYATVSGGIGNLAIKDRATVSGGRENIASGIASVVGGGYSNRVAQSYGTIGGGYNNANNGYVATVAGGWGNAANGKVSTVGGGQDNSANGAASTTAGGWQNRAEGSAAVVSGGHSNVAEGNYASIGGGTNNLASGDFAVVPGGSENEAAGAHSFAGGHGAKAAHPGSFVWSDNQPGRIASTAPDQFIIQAGGNVGIDTNAPAEKLTVAGNVKAQQFIGDGSRLTGIQAPDALTAKSEFAGEVFGTPGNLRIRPGVVGSDHLAPGLLEESVNKSAVAGQVAQLMRNSVSRDTIINGDVAGTLDQLQLKPGVVTADKLAPNVLSDAVQKSPVAAQVAKMSGTMVTRDQVMKGDVVGTVDNLKIKPGAITADKLAENVLSEALQKSALATQMAKMSGTMLTRDEVVTGDVVGTLDNLQIKPGAITADKLAKNVVSDAVQQSALAAQVAKMSVQLAATKDQAVAGDVTGSLGDLRLKKGVVTPEKLSPEIRAGLQQLEEDSLSKETNFAGDVQGTADKLELRKGAVTADKLAPNVLQDALKQSLVAGEMAQLRRSVVTRDYIASGEVVGPLDGLKVQPGTITADKLSPELAKALQTLEDKVARGPVKFGGDVMGAASNLTVRAGAITADKLAPGVVEQSINDSQLAAVVSQLSRKTVSRDQVVQGDVAGTLDNLQLRKGSVTAEKLDPKLMAKLQEANGEYLPAAAQFAGEVEGTAKNLRLKEGLLDQAIIQNKVIQNLASELEKSKAQGVQSEQILAAIERLNKNALSVNTTFNGDVMGTPKALKIQRGAVRAEHLANGSVTAEKLNIAGDFGPSRTSIDSLGTSKERWKALYVSDRVDYDRALTFTSGGVVRMVVDGTGNLSVQGLRLQGDKESPSLIGGHSANRIDEGVLGATIAGGGNANQPNVISSQYGSIAGGFGNRVTGFDSSIGGGQDNTAGGKASTIAGGFTNQADGLFPSVGGGAANQALANAAVISGGFSNKVEGAYATIPGGYQNFATGDFSLAAGYRAVAGHAGSFVWSDSSAGDFSTTGRNQFAVRASGGTQIFTSPDQATGVKLNPGSGSWSMLSDRNSKENVVEIDSEEVLDHLSDLPIYSWNYRAQNPDVRHVGPVSQDFYEAFGMGENDTHITAIDADGIALSAIKGLLGRLEEREKEIAALREENDDLRTRFTDVESKVDQFFKLLDNLPAE